MFNVFTFIFSSQAAGTNSCYEQASTTFTLDLSDNDTLEFEGCEPGEYKVKVINVVPLYKYNYKTKRSLIPNQKLINPSDVTVPFASVAAVRPRCEATAEQAYNQILTAKNEIEVSQFIESIEAELVNDPSCVVIQGILDSAKKSTQTVKKFLY